MLISQFFIIILTVSLSDANIIHISREINVQTMYNTAGICSIAAEFVSAPPLSCESMVNRPLFRSLVVRGLRLYMLELMRFIGALSLYSRRKVSERIGEGHYDIVQAQSPMLLCYKSCLPQAFTSILVPH